MTLGGECGLLHTHNSLLDRLMRFLVSMLIFSISAGDSSLMPSQLPFACTEPCHALTHAPPP